MYSASVSYLQGRIHKVFFLTGKIFCLYDLIDRAFLFMSESHISQSTLYVYQNGVYFGLVDLDTNFGRTIDIHPHRTDPDDIL